MRACTHEHKSYNAVLKTSPVCLPVYVHSHTSGCQQSTEAIFFSIYDAAPRRKFVNSTPLLPPWREIVVLNIFASQEGSLHCATYPWPIASANRGSERRRTIKLYQLTSPVTTASAVGTAQIPASI